MTCKPSSCFHLSSSLLIASAIVAWLPAPVSGQAAGGSPSADTTNCAAGQSSSCLSASSVIPLTFLVLFLIILLLWCALHICCNFPCCCCCGCRMPHWGCLGRSSKQQSQVHTHLHAEDIPLTHPMLASPAAHLAPLISPPAAAPYYRPYKGQYRIGKNHHLQPFTLNLRFDYTTSPRSLTGHGIDDGQSFQLTDAAFTVNDTGEHKCVFVERFGDGSRYVFYGQWEGGSEADERWSGFWLRESGVSQQGTFSFQWDEVAEEQMREARQAGETDVDGWMERRMREQQAARERRYIVLRGLEERKKTTDGTTLAQRSGRDVEDREDTAIELMERRLNRPTTATSDATTLHEVTVDIPVSSDAS